MVDSLPLPPPQVPLFNNDGKPTQQGFEFLDRLQSLVKQLKAVTNIFDGLNATQSTALLDIFTSTLKGLVPLSGGGTANFLRADGSWAPPPVGTGGLTLLSSASVGAGTTYSVTGLGGYKMFRIILNGVSHNNAAVQTFRIAVSGDGGSSYGTAIAITTSSFANTVLLSGEAIVDRVDQTNNQFVGIPAVGGGSGGTDSSSRGPIDALQFSWSAGNFDAGTIDIYGLK